MFFNNVLMNPPYDRNLHIKILEQVILMLMDEKSVCSNLSPIRWLQDPLAEYKQSKTDYVSFENTVGKHIETLDVQDENLVEKWFETPIPISLGVYKIRKQDHFTAYQFAKNKIVDKIISHKNFKPIGEHIILSEPMGYAVIAPLMYKGTGPHKIESAVSHWMIEPERAFYNDNNNTTTGETYFEYRKKVSWGKVKPRPDITNIKFDSAEERQNFYDTCETDFFRYIFTIETIDVHVQVDFLPWMPDYKNVWTNERLCDYFGITTDEWQEMEKFMSLYK